MLRMLIWLDPSRKDEIFSKSIRDKKMEGLQHLEKKRVDLDPE